MKKHSFENKAGWAFVAYIMVIVALALPGAAPRQVEKQQPGPISTSIPLHLPPTIAGMPVVLSERDSALYTDAFKAQRAFDWPTANLALAQISNPLLRGHVLAERYLSRKYEATPVELAAWLASYRDLPQAYDIYQLAKRKYDLPVEEFRKPDLISMRGDDNGLARSFGESKHVHTWRAAIAAYKSGHYANAAEGFDALLAHPEELSVWKISAAGFWSWRAHSKLGNHEKAQASLQLAANEPRSFYGILARKQLGQPLELNRSGLTLSDEQTESLNQYQAAQRAIALVQANRNDLAENELRALYSELRGGQRYALLCLAHQLSLPALQIALAKRLESKEQPLDLAKYPIPEWEPVGGFNVDPALIYALVRQESGFRNGAISPAGAMGLMQLMPTTASMMTHKIGAYRINAASDAEKNITLGQSYVRHLLENQLVDNNMIYMLTAYNAGIGRLQEWKNTSDYQNDPLLFIETMPYAETRHYVMQVMTNYWLYNEILGVPSPSLSALAANEWPVYVREG